MTIYINEINKWISDNDLHTCDNFEAKISHDACKINKLRYKTQLKEEEYIEEDFVEQILHCVHKCNGLKTNKSES